MVSDICEKGVSVNDKVKILNFPGGASENILEKLDDIIKEKPEISWFMLELMISLIM